MAVAVAMAKLPVYKLCSTNDAVNVVVGPELESVILVVLL